MLSSTSSSVSLEENSYSFNQFLLNCDIVQNANGLQIFKTGCQSKYRDRAYQLMQSNKQLTQQIEKISEEKHRLESLLMNIEKKQKSNLPVQEVKKEKRYRRSAAQITRLYTCPIPTCTKFYGSEGSLTQHLKIKHPNLNDLINQFQQS